jgi:hypothetical protein
MAKAFSVASWNVRHFNKSGPDVVADEARVNRVLTFLKNQNPDVFGIYEVEGKDLFGEIVSQFPGYAFQITEGPETQEILVGARSTLSPFFTQKIEFKAGVTAMRPGLLTAVTVDDVKYGLLFLHLASASEPRGMGLRDDMIERAIKFRRTLDATTPDKKANYIFLGDLNIMGMKYPFNKSIDASFELQKWDAEGKKTYAMRRLLKTVEKTWSDLSSSKLPPSNLDQAFASDHLTFKKFKSETNKDVEIDVRGWVNEKTNTEKDNWIKSYSDHSLIYFEVEKVTG